MTRKRLAGTAFTTYDDVDAALKRIGTIDREIGLIEAATNEGIDHLKQSAKTRVEPLATIKGALEAQVKEFCEANRADFATTRSRELVFGTVSFRRSTSVVIKRVADCLAAVKALGLSQCIRIKEELDKEQLAALPTETLANVGASLKVVDAFGYDIKREVIDALPVKG